ncbi:relaxase/mobilization nuclease domain-containing protein [Salinibacter altiplanensis]|uniref:relaxase/mobilization nuclease domain-containing protein n=1 Tax=Salinibacter altiplanensis TaxID=1803181 RepID=UPI000C9F6A5F|nr:relaxase/mobilization nuclease domain-containing protein [Salinibacter altiplanensis]
MVSSTSIGGDFGGLARYLVGEDLTSESDRVSYVGGQHLFKNDPEWALMQMRDTAAASGRTQKPVYHISTSFPGKDETTREERLWAMKEILRDLGLEEHQALFVEHEDTHYDHLHAMVNRVHPETKNAWSNSHDWKQIEKTERRIEGKMGWEQVAGFHARPEGFKKPTPALSKAEVKRKRQDGEEPFSESVGRRAGGDFKSARAWRWLEEDLAEKGIWLEMEGYPGRGGVVTNGDDIAALSAVALELSGPRLAQRFGESYSEYARRRGVSRSSVGQRDPAQNGISQDDLRDEEKRDASRQESTLQERADSEETALEEITEAARRAHRCLSAFEESTRKESTGQESTGGEVSPRRVTALKEETLQAWKRLEADERRFLRGALAPPENRHLDLAIRRPERSGRQDPRAQMSRQHRKTWRSLRRLMRAEASSGGQDPLTHLAKGDLQEKLSESLKAADTPDVQDFRRALSDREEDSLDRARKEQKKKSRRSRRRSRERGR